MPRFRLLIEYDGSSFHGWQIQPNQPTVQEALESALSTILRTDISVVGSGRTDTGVHARGQIAHFTTEGDADEAKLLRSLNGILPDAIAVLAVEQAPEDFHARYDARRRLYLYFVSSAPRALDRHRRWKLWPTPDFNCMNQAANELLGTHDFDSFCITQSETKNRVCTVERAIWLEDGRRNDWRFEIAADRFLHGMVRAIVGTLVEIGHGKRPVDDMTRIIAAQDRRCAGQAAPSHGLALERVEYPEPIFFQSKEAEPMMVSTQPIKN